MGLELHFGLRRSCLARIYPVQRAGKVVEAQYYENEGHGFVKRENQIDALGQTVDWLEKWLR